MPYENLPPEAFWKLCREDEDFRITDLHQPKFALQPGTHVATAGSCFAQNIGRYLRGTDLNLVDMEPAPDLMDAETARTFGYGLYSARYGNIYTARQLRQLLQDAMDETLHECAIWERDGRYFDALRPSCEPEGFATAEAVRAHRFTHLSQVRAMFAEAEAFVFTLGLTEAWRDRETGVVFPSAPGVIAGNFDEAKHEFVNFGFAETLQDLTEAIGLMRSLAPELSVILTVSPVPLTATASGKHVLQATTYSKSVLRAVAGEVADQDPLVDYFPSYEIFTGIPFAGRYYADNMRSVDEEGVAVAMQLFFNSYAQLCPSDLSGAEIAPIQADEAEDEVICEEALLESFAKP